jgi:hypothetical protein
VGDFDIAVIYAGMRLLLSDAGPMIRIELSSVIDAGGGDATNGPTVLNDLSLRIALGRSSRPESLSLRERRAGASWLLIWPFHPLSWNGLPQFVHRSEFPDALLAARCNRNRGS